MIEYFPYHRKLLKKKEVKELLNHFDQTLLHVGTMSGGDNETTRQIKQAYNGYFEDPSANKIIYDALDRDSGFCWRTIAQTTERPMLSKSKLGQFYHPHQDSPILGDYSTSIVLNDDFEGGELQLRVAGEVKNYKFKPGEAVTYPTGMDHCVRPVTKGERKAIVIWTKSSVTDPLLREIACLSNKAYHILAKEKDRRKENPYLFEDGIEQASNDPLWLVDKIFSLIGRADGSQWYSRNNGYDQ
jgi:PKHD-type hydroxylase|tara:strand:- start:1059 stop:1787 length:729 start_codon:yes stop_codon:yes gene_type:complete